MNQVIYNSKRIKDKKRALIIGILGQDGFYLSKLLISKGYEVHGIARRIPNILPNNFSSSIILHECDIVHSGKLSQIIEEIIPYEIFHLAAYHFSSHTKGNKESNLGSFIEVNVNSLYEILETLKIKLPKTRLFYASSSHIFGNPTISPQNEFTNYAPNSLYAISKVAAGNLCNFYREYYNLYVSVGILYNHESPLRPANFLSSLIVNAAANVALGMDYKLTLNDLNGIVDWGAAEDYVEAMWSTLQQEYSDNYIIASGIGRSVFDFVQVAFSHIGKNSIDYVFQNSEIINKNNFKPLIGDSSKIREVCNWRPVISFQELVTSLVDEQINKLREVL
jgi:GDPmannose 4,6-dehydratase